MPFLVEAESQDGDLFKGTFETYGEAIAFEQGCFFMPTQDYDMGAVFIKEVDR